LPFQPNPVTIAVMESSSPASRRVDWLLFYLRWLLLAVVGVIGFSSPGERAPMIALLLIGAAYNLAVLLMLSAEFARAILPAATLLLDSLLAAAIFQFSGRAAGPLAWVALFPVLSAALRFGLAAGLGALAVILAAEAALILQFDSDQPGSLLELLYQGLILLLMAVLAGLAGKRGQTTPAGDAAQEQNSRQLRPARDQVRAIYQMASAMSANLNYERVLEAALDLGSLGVAQLGDGADPGEDEASQMVSAAMLLDDEGLYVAAARRLTQTDLRVRLAGSDGLLANLLKTGESAHTTEAIQDPELKTFVSFRSCSSLVCVPMGAGFEVLGVFLFGHPRAGYFEPDRVELLEAIGNQAAVSLNNARLYRNLELEKERIVEVEEEARKKLARDLHDGPTQSVAAIAMRTNYARRLMERDPQTASAELFRVEDLARRTTKEIRHMLFTLRPLILESQGLEAALRQLAEKTRETHGQKVTVEAGPGATQDLEMGKQGVIFYIAEEAINNARKHAEAEMIWVRLLPQGDIFALEVEDNGVGFNVGAVDASYDQRGSLGMVNMRERAELVNGMLRLESAEGRGTLIRLQVPLTEAAQDRLRR